MRRVQNSTPITDFGGRKQISFDALFSSDSEGEGEAEAHAQAHAQAQVQAHAQAPVAAEELSSQHPYCRDDDPISVWTQKVTESFEKASKKQLPPDFKESLGRLSFFRKPPPEEQEQKQKSSVTKEEPCTTTINAQ
jgi:hypothetical protein